MNQKGISYHWAIVIACFLLTAVSIGITVNCFSPLSVELIKKYESASAVQYIFMIAALTNLIGSALVGKIMSKFSMRIAMPVYAIIMSAGVYMWSNCTSLPMYYIVSLFVGFGASGIAIIPCGALINNWFEEKKGMATGIAFTGSVAGGLLLVQLTKNILASYDLQTAYLALAIVAAVISIPTTLFVVREHPRDKGLLPYGAKETANTGQELIRGITLKQYIKTSSFWLLAVSVFIISFINVGMQNNLAIDLTATKGYDQIFAANVFSIYLLVQIFGKVLLGSIYDKMGIKVGTVYCVMAYLFSAGLLLYSGQVYLAIIFGVFFGLVGSMSTVKPPYVTAKIVGLKDYSTIFGILNLFYGIGLVTGPVVAAKIYDSTGSYDKAWFAFAGLAVILGFTTLIATKKGEGFSNLA
jgi:MFS family permease